jgi:YD repeat-containing protein
VRSALSEAVRRPDLPVSVNIASHVRLPSCPRTKPLVWTADRVRQWQVDGVVPANPAKPTSVTTPDGDTLEMSYDDAGNLTSAVQEEMDIEVADIRYHSNGLVEQVTDANGNSTSYSYDRAGNMTAMDEPGPMGTMEFGYDALSRVTSVTDGNGVTLEYGYDRLDRIVSISQGGDLLQAIDYDGNGRQVATHTDQASVEHSYNGRGDLLQTVRTDSAGSETTTYAYDAAGNVTEMVEHGKTTTYGYDAAFRLIRWQCCGHRRNSFRNSCIRGCCRRRGSSFRHRYRYLA